jgi:hypothetical protein
MSMMNATFVSAGKDQHSGEGRPCAALATRRARELAGLRARRGLLARLLGALAACAGPAPEGKPARPAPPPAVEGPGGLTLAAGAPALFFSIYTDASRDAAREAAAHGDVGIAVESRGKRLSPVAGARASVATRWPAGRWCRSLR